MTKHVDSFLNHNTHNLLNELRTTLEAHLEESEKPDEVNRERLERLLQLGIFIQNRINLAIPEISPINALDQVAGCVQNTLNLLNMFNSDNNPTHLNKANTHLDNAIPPLNLTLTVATPGEVEGFKEAILAFRRSASQNIRRLEEEETSLLTKYQEVLSKYHSLEGEINTQKGRLDTAITEFQKQFSEAEDRRRVQHSQSEKQMDTDFRQLVENFEEIQEGLVSDFKKDASQTLSSGSKTFENESNDMKNSAKSIITTLMDYRDQAGKLVTVITNTGMVGGYQKVANHERRAGYVWKTIAIIAFIGLIAFAIYAFKSTLGPDLNISKLASRIFVAITFGILAAYAARQADKHEENERRNRKMELELASIGPYLLELPSDKQNSIKEDLASKLFARNDLIQWPSDPKTTGSVVDILKLFLTTIENLSKK